MRTLAAALVVVSISGVVATAGTAHAEERGTKMWIGGLIGARGDLGNYEAQPAAIGGPRVTLGWETPMIAYPAEPGYRADFALTPELLAGAMFDEGPVQGERSGTRAEGMVGVGLRGELRLAQYRMGLLKISMRGSIYLAARAFVIGEQRDTVAEFAFGEYFLVGRTGRIGFELNVQSRHRNAMPEDREAAVLTQFYVGWAL
jgi:hypothetical protein